MTRAAFVLAEREVLRFLRSPSRIAGALGTPLVFWLLIGTGLTAAFRAPGTANVSYRAYFFPGILLLVVFFTAIFSAISVIEDRREGFLQGVLASPAPRGAIVLGKSLGAGLVAALEGVFLLALGALFAGGISPGRFLLAGAILFALAASLVAFGIALAWRFDSTQDFHAVMNLLLLPLWILSGAVFPIAGSPDLLAFVVRANPLTYALALLRRVLDPAAALADPALPGAALSAIVVVLGAAACFAAAVAAVGRGEA